MGKTRSASNIDSIFVLLVFSIFAASVLMVLMLGAGIYQNTSTIIQDEYDSRTGLSYIWSRVRNSDSLNGITLVDFHDQLVLCLEETFNETTYQTLIYQHDGWICELFSEYAQEFDLEHGTTMIPAQELHFENLGRGLIRASMEFGSILLYPRSQSNLAKMANP